MNILSFGDLHYRGNGDEDIETAMNQITKEAKDIGPSLIVITGDIYESASNAAARNLVTRHIQNLALVAPVSIIYGNHDTPGDLDIFNKLYTKNNVNVYGYPKATQVGHTGLYFLPWISKALWMQEYLKGFYKISDTQEMLSERIIQYLKHLKSQFPKATQHVVIGHMTLRGSKTETNQILIGDGVTLSPYELEEAGFTAGIFGHIHMRQEMGNGMFIYNGSPCPHNYGEKNDKFYSVMDVDARKVEWFQIHTRPRRLYYGEWKEGRWHSEDEIEGMDIKDAKVKIIFDISAEEDIDFAKAEIKKMFMIHGPHEIKLEPMIISTNLVRSEDIIKANTFEDKLLCYWNSSDVFVSEQDRKEILKKLRKLEEICETKSLF